MPGPRQRYAGVWPQDRPPMGRTAAPEHGVQDLLKQRPQVSFSHVENDLRSAAPSHFTWFWRVLGLENRGAGASTALARTWVFQTVGHQTKARRFVGVGFGLPQIASFQPQPNPQPFSLNQSLFPSSSNMLALWVAFNTNCGCVTVEIQRQPSYAFWNTFTSYCREVVC